MVSPVILVLNCIEYQFVTKYLVFMLANALRLLCHAWVSTHVLVWKEICFSHLLWSVPPRSLPHVSGRLSLWHNYLNIPSSYQVSICMWNCGKWPQSLVSGLWLCYANQTERSPKFVSNIFASECPVLHTREIYHKQIGHWNILVSFSLQLSFPTQFCSKAGLNRQLSCNKKRTLCEIYTCT